jgi:DNA/RNA-binding domain of Phe-tRNA-synthetase-like protein
MFDITISSIFKQACPDFKGVAVYASVSNTSYNEPLWKEIADFTKQLLATSQIEDIKLQPAIAATREGYKRCGKDPARYRVSSEALRRRLLRGLDLYQIDTLVDLVNLVSLQSGYSIGGFDADKIQGNQVELGIGRHDEPYEGIGRGMLNIENLPVYRDEVGGIGTPTSDNERTKMDISTKHILAIINGYDKGEHLAEAVELMKRLLTEYADAKDFEIVYFE